MSTKSTTIGQKVFHGIDVTDVKCFADMVAGLLSMDSGDHFFKITNSIIKPDPGSSTTPTVSINRNREAHPDAVLSTATATALMMVRRASKIANISLSEIISIGGNTQITPTSPPSAAGTSSNVATSRDKSEPKDDGADRVMLAFAELVQALILPKMLNIPKYKQRAASDSVTVLMSLFQTCVRSTTRRLVFVDQQYRQLNALDVIDDAVTLGLGY
jgi:hypothetical protein